MQVAQVRMWGGVAVPDQFYGDGPFEITLEMIDELSKLFDVAIMNHRQPQPTRRERGRGAKEVPDKRILWLDQRGGGFKQR